MQIQSEIVDSLRRIVQSLRTSSRETEKHLGISSAQLFVLQILSSGKSMSINELAERTRTHQSSASVVISRLEEAGMVRREQSPKDRRSHEISLTTKGAKMLATKKPLAQERLISAVAELAIKDQEALARLLAKVVDSLGVEPGPASFFFEDEKQELRGKKSR